MRNTSIGAVMGFRRISICSRGVLQAGKRIDHRGNVHPQLHAKAHSNGKVTVLGGQGGNDNTHTQAQQHNFQHYQRHSERPGCQVYTRPGHGEVDPEQNVHDKLDKEVDQAGKHLTDGCGKPRKIYLAEHLTVGNKGIGGSVDAGGKKVHTVLPAM